MTGEGAQVTQASHAEPYLTLKIDLDPERITELATKVFPHGMPQPRESRPLFIGEADTHIVDAATRLMTLLERPVNAELIGPLVIDEIVIRLLAGPMGPRIAQMGLSDSSLSRIARAVSWLRENYDQPADVRVSLAFAWPTSSRARPAPGCAAGSPRRSR